jgi:hypothetical protein
MSIAIPPGLIAHYRKSLTEYVARKCYEVIIRSYPKDGYPDINNDDWEERAVRGIFWYRSEILAVLTNGLHLVQSVDGAVFYLDYSWIRRLEMDGDRFYGEPHIFIRPPARFFRAIGHAAGVDAPGAPDSNRVVRDHGEMEADRRGLLPEFHVFSNKDLRTLGYPRRNMRWLTNAEAYHLQVPWRYVLAQHGDIEYRVKDRSDRVLVRVQRRAASRTPASPSVIERTGPAFFKQGSYWVLRYRGTTVSIRDTKGLTIINALLRNQKRGVPLADLVMVPIAELHPLSDPDDVPGREEGIDLTDPETIAQCRSELARIESGLRKAEASGNQAEMSRLKADKRKVELYLSSTTDLRGRPRRSSSALKKMQDMITKRFQRAMKSIKREHNVLWKHLDNSIHRLGGVSYIYDPDEHIDWEL